MRTAAARTAGYLATVLPGLEDVLASEVAAKLPAVRTGDRARGRVLLSGAEGEDLSALRTADNVYRLIGRLRVGAHRADLSALADAVRRLPFPPLAGGRPTFFVNASRAGTHTYSRFEAAEAAASGVAGRFPRWARGTPEAHDLEFRLDVLGAEALLSLRLTRPSFRYRGAERAFAPGSLRPSVAHGLVWLSRPGDGDHFVDPFCGSGTIVGERLAYPAATVRGGDRSPAALEAAAHNLRGAGRGVLLSLWDARSLPLEARSVDRVVTNLPFGQQVGASAEIPALYRAFALELRRVLRAGGTAILLTDRLADLAAAVAEAGLGCDELAHLSLKGRHPRVFRARS